MTKLNKKQNLAQNTLNVNEPHTRFLIPSQEAQTHTLAQLNMFLTLFFTDLLWALKPSLEATHFFKQVNLDSDSSNHRHK